MLSIMEYVHFAHWDHNQVLIKVDAYVLAIKNGYQLHSHVYNVKPMLHQYPTNQSVCATMVSLIITVMVFAILTVI